MNHITKHQRAELQRSADLALALGLTQAQVAKYLEQTYSISPQRANNHAARAVMAQRANQIRAGSPGKN